MLNIEKIKNANLIDEYKWKLNASPAHGEWGLPKNKLTFALVDGIEQSRFFNEQEIESMKPLKNKKLIIPEIETYNIIVPNKVVEVIFTDGEVIKTVCHNEDVFKVEDMIMVAMLKKSMGSAGNFNNYMKRAVRTWNEMIECERKEKEEAERLEKKREKLAEKSKRRYEKRKARRDEEAKAKKQAEIDEKIHIQTQAYIKAMEYMENKKTKKKNKKSGEE